jgi:hypothetical protein
MLVLWADTLKAKLPHEIHKGQSCILCLSPFVISDVSLFCLCLLILALRLLIADPT